MIKLVKFHYRNKQRIFINPEQVCAVYGNVTIRTADGVAYDVNESLFDIIEKLTHTGKGKPKVLNSCKEKKL